MIILRIIEEEVSEKELNRLTGIMYPEKTGNITLEAFLECMA